MDTQEALYIITRALHDMAPKDNAVRDLLWQLEADLRGQTEDPSQTDFRETLAVRGAHEARVMAGRV